MLTYNIFIFTIAFLLYLDYLSVQYTVKVRFEGNAFYLGNTFMYVALIVIIFFAGFRFEIGYDYTKYLAGYLYDSQLSEWEPFFTFLVRVIRVVNFGLDLQALFLFFSALTMIFVYKAIRVLTPYYRTSLLLYLLIPSYFMSGFSVIRQGIALAILFYAFHYLTVKNDVKKYALFAFFAAMFHYASMFTSGMYIFGKKFFKPLYSQWTYTFLILISFFLGLIHFGKLFVAYMPGHFSAYADFDTHSVSIFKLIVVNGMFIFLLLQKNSFVKTQLDRYLFNSLFVGVLIFNTFRDLTFVTRVAQYIMIVEIILVPAYLNSIKERLTKTVLIGLFSFYYLLNFNYALLRDMQYREEHPTVQTLVPYKNYFFEESTSYRNQFLKAWSDFILEYKESEEQRE